MAKAKLDKEHQFEPVKIVCTLETQGELNAFTAAFNYVPICEAKGVRNSWCECIREVGIAAGGEPGVTIFQK